MTKTNEQTLIQHYLAGCQKSGEQLLLANERLIYDIARKEFCGYLGQSHEVDDLVQIGRIAFLDSVHSWDPKGGSKFVTYAAQRMKWRMRDLIKQSHRRLDTGLLEVYAEEEGQFDNDEYKALDNMDCQLVLEEVVNSDVFNDMYAKTIYTAYIAGMNCTEMTKILDLPFSIHTVRKMVKGITNELTLTYKV